MKNKNTYEYEIFKELDFIYARYRGEFNIKELLCAMELVWNHPLYRTDINGAIDMRDARLTANLSDLKYFIKILTASPKRTSASIAILVNEKRTTGFLLTFIYYVGSLMNIGVFQLPENAMIFVGKYLKFFEHLNSLPLKKCELDTAKV